MQFLEQRALDFACSMVLLYTVLAQALNQLLYANAALHTSSKKRANMRLHTMFRCDSQNRSIVAVKQKCRECLLRVIIVESLRRERNRECKDYETDHIAPLAGLASANQSA